VGRVNYSKEKICIGRGLASIRSKDKLLNQNYLFYLLKNEEDNFILQSGGSIYDSINKDKLNGFEVNIPTVDTQNKSPMFYRLTTILSKTTPAGFRF